MTGSPPDLAGIGGDELKRLLLEALEKIAALTEKISALSEKMSALTEKNAALHAEIARLKGLKGPPQIKPSGMEKASTPSTPRGKGGRGGGGGSARMAVVEDRLVTIAVPAGSGFKAPAEFVPAQRAHEQRVQFGVLRSQRRPRPQHRLGERSQQRVAAGQLAHPSLETARPPALSFTPNTLRL
jgi:hypothetical protein